MTASGVPFNENEINHLNNSITDKCIHHKDPTKWYHEFDQLLEDNFN